MALILNGSNYIANTTVAPINAVPLTIACWFRPSAVNGTLVAFNSATAGNITLTVNASSQIVAGTRDDSFTSQNATTTTAVTLGNMHHVAGVFASASSRTAYLDGVASSTNTNSVGAITLLNRFTIGARNQATFDSFGRGIIAEVAVWNVALTASEIASLAKGFRPSRIRPNSLALYAPFIRARHDLRNNLILTDGGGTALVDDHPRII
jgi:hypothetical protein